MGSGRAVFSLEPVAANCAALVYRRRRLDGGRGCMRPVFKGASLSAIPRPNTAPVKARIASASRSRSTRWVISLLACAAYLPLTACGGPYRADTPMNATAADTRATPPLVDDPSGEFARGGHLRFDQRASGQDRLRQHPAIMQVGRRIPELHAAILAPHEDHRKLGLVGHEAFVDAGHARKAHAAGFQR